MIEVPIRPLFSPKGSNLPNFRRGAALRRAVAKFHGLLRGGRNRKTPWSESLFNREDVGGPLDLAGGTALMIRRLIVPLTVAVVTIHAGHALAQGAFPAPLPGQTPMRNDPAFPPVNGAAPAASVGAPPSSFPVQGAAPVTGAGFERGPAPPSRSGNNLEK